MSSTIELCQQNVTEILKTVRRLGPKFPSMIWGSPGIGKTKATLDTFKDHRVVLVLAGCSEPTDISGVPFEYKCDGKPVATQILAPIWAWHASVEAPPEYINQKMVIFFDDIVTGHPQTQAACFKVFGEHRVGNLKLRDDVFLIAAGNRVEDKSAAFEMPMALANRMKHYYAKCDNDAWVTWALDNGIHPLIVAYIRRQGHRLNTFDEVVKLSSTEKAFATPRTWEMLSDCMWALGPDGVVGEWLHRTAVGCVGSGIGIEFSTFAKTTDSLVRAEDIVAHPDTARIPNKTEIDVLYATISGLEYYINQPENYKYWDRALQYVLRPEIEPEFGLLIAKMAVVIALGKLDEKGRVAATSNPWFTKMYSMYGKYIANVV